MVSGMWRNWGRNQSCRPAALDEPSSVLEVVEALDAAARAGQRVRVAASGHSFTDAACTDGRMLRLSRLDRVVALDRDALTITVEAGMPLRRLNEELALRGLALANLGDVDRQSVAGALATGTHGTGRAFGGLATFVREIELVTADGEVLRCSPDIEPEVFSCARVSLGALGVITRYTLQCVPAFRLHSVERPVPFGALVSDWDDLVATNEHVDAYWWPYTDVCTVKRNNRTDDPVRIRPPARRWRDEILLANGVFGGLCAVGRVVPALVPGLVRRTASTLGKTELVDRSDRVFCSRRLVRFVEMEYSIPQHDLMEALQRVRELVDGERLRVDFPVELRVAAADDIPLSTASGRSSAYLAVHVSSGTPYEAYFRGVEAIMDELGGRPHWGKLHFQTAASLAPRYPEWDRFAAVRSRLDPAGRFANPYLDRVLGTP